MADREDLRDAWVMRMVSKRVAKKGFRPRVAATVVAGFWVSAIFIFGTLERIVNPDRFESLGDGLWWATQTVTTVGYGDVVPDDGAGRVVASILMIGGLSLFAVITGVITSAFVARAQVHERQEEDDSIAARMAEIQSQLAAVKTDLASIAANLDQRPR